MTTIVLIVLFAAGPSLFGGFLVGLGIKTLRRGRMPGEVHGLLPIALGIFIAVAYNAAAVYISFNMPL